MSGPRPTKGLTDQDRARLIELEADEALDQLTPEGRSELRSLRERYGVEASPIDPLAELAAKAAGRDPMPTDVRDRLQKVGEGLVRSGREAGMPAGRIGGGGQRNQLLLAAAAVIALFAAGGLWVRIASERRSHEETLAAARTSQDELRARLAAVETEAARAALALAEATRSLDEATLKIAKLEAPIDPTEVAQNRRKLLELPGTVRLAWKPFDLPDSPAELASVQGDVVWNDNLEQGYLRFVGLRPNDPNVEQYQIWVIDERGMEQKVSGGVFNASAEGEIVVPINPSIDLRRVALFAVTIEEPGGTVVPSLKRRVVIAPREG